MTETEMILERLEKLERQFNEKLDCFEKKLLDPDNGLFTRVKENTNFRKTMVKWLSIITLTVIGLLGKFIYDFLTGKF